MKFQSDFILEHEWKYMSSCWIFSKNNFSQPKNQLCLLIPNDKQLLSKTPGNIAWSIP